MVGIISRANLMHALASSLTISPERVPSNNSQGSAITSLQCSTSRAWAPRINVVVKNGVAELVGRHHRSTPTASGKAVDRCGRECRRR